MSTCYADTGEMYDVRELDGSAPCRFSILPEALASLPREQRLSVPVSKEKQIEMKKAPLLTPPLTPPTAAPSPQSSASIAAVSTYREYATYYEVI